MLRDIFGAVLPTIEFFPTRRRYPIIAYKMPRSFLAVPRRMHRMSVEQEQWWQASVTRASHADLAGVRALFAEAQRRFQVASLMQPLTTIGIVQPLLAILAAIVDRSGAGDVALLSGVGGAELAVVTDLWRASRGEVDVPEVVRRHGFHGPLEGELSSRVWRDDDAPIRALVDRYTARPDREDPRLMQAEKTLALATMQREVAGQFPRIARPAVQALLHIAASRIQLRGVGKRSLLQALDAARAAARRAGALLTDADILDDPEDVFYLTGDELLDSRLNGARDLVAQRRAQRAAYRQQRFAAPQWQGLPTIVDDESDSPPARLRLDGEGVSGGVVEGTVRVILDPAADDAQPNDILVAPVTDPSWSALMFISAGLIVDVGGALSHAAVVARELGIPCVVATGDGTRVLRTGDRVRLDGGRGTVEILQRATSQT